MNESPNFSRALAILAVRNRHASCQFGRTEAESDLCNNTLLKSPSAKNISVLG